MEYTSRLSAFLVGGGVGIYALVVEAKLLADVSPTFAWCVCICAQVHLLSTPGFLVLMSDTTNLPRVCSHLGMVLPWHRYQSDHLCSQYTLLTYHSLIERLRHICMAGDILI